MKKLLLTLTAATVSFSGVFAQTAQSHLSLYEEFSGENCAPCAASNPGLLTLLNANTSNVILVKYQSPIPSAGPIYNLYKTVTDARLTYYSVPFAPYGRLNGTGLGTGTAASGSPGHIANLTQSDLTTAASVASPFNITATHAWSTNGDSVTVTVNVTANAAYSASGTTPALKLRAALIEHLVYATAPGTNGEKDFHNVVREMYPNAAGTAVSNTWTAGQTMTYTLKGRAPYYVDKNGADTRVVVWFQNDADKSIPQAAASAPVSVPLDIASSAISTPSSVACATTSTTVTPTVTLKNTGTTPLTRATIYSRVDAGTLVSQNWTGSLAAGATTTVTLAPLTLTPGTRTIYDSVATPNGMVDANQGNNTSTKQITVINTTGISYPVSQNFEVSGGGFPTGYYSYEPAGAGNVWVNGNGTNLAHNGSSYMPWYKIGTYAAGSVGYLIIPTLTVGNNRSIEFYQAYAQKTSANNDKLELVYSTDCGTTWTALWSAAGSTLATTAPTTTYWLPSPSASTTDWKLRTVAIPTTVPGTALMAFRATADGGNNLFLDDISYKGTPTGVTNVIANASLSLVPNPATNTTKLGFSLSQKGNVHIQVVDNLGRTVADVANGSMDAGQQAFEINTSGFAAGVYNIVLATEGGVVNQRLTVIK